MRTPSRDAAGPHPRSRPRSSGARAGRVGARPRGERRRRSRSASTTRRRASRGGSRSDRRGVLQTAYRVLVATRPRAAARAGARDVWDSGTRRLRRPVGALRGTAAAIAHALLLDGARLDDAAGRGDASPARRVVRDRAIWTPPSGAARGSPGPERTRVLHAGRGRRRRRRDPRGRRASAGRRRGSRSGFAADRFPNDQGECRELRPAPMLRQGVPVTKPVARARVYSSGLAYNLADPQRRRGSDRVLDPGFTDYSKTVLYTTHDVTPLLTAGRERAGRRARVRPVRRATRTWDWGWERRRVARRRRGCGSTCTSRTRDGTRGRRRDPTRRGG